MCLVFASICELALGVAPAGEVALDDFLVRTRRRQLAACSVDGGLPSRVRGDCARVSCNCVVELMPTSRHIAFGKRERVCGSRRRRWQCGERSAGRLDAGRSGCDFLGGGTRVPDGSCEIIALRTLVEAPYFT